MFRNNKSDYFRTNVRFLIKSRGETQVSLCAASGLTRTTIYNILEGRVSNVQQSTVRKISDFFGVSYEEIEQIDFEEREALDRSISLEGNMNPAAVPIIKEGLLLKCLDKSIGELVTLFPLTYYFGSAHNMLGVLLENECSSSYGAGDVLIINKGRVSKTGDHLAYNTISYRLSLINEGGVGSSELCVIGHVVEERFNGM